MRDVLVVLFWLWLLIALGVYGYRIWRRATQGPKSRRDAARQAHEEADTSRGGLLSRSTPPPLPDGPVEARLPKALQDQGAFPTDDLAATAGDGTPDGDGPRVPPPAPRVVALADALKGIRMPDRLLPVVDPADPDRDRTARFSGTGTTVEAVTSGLADELRRLGFAVDGLETATPARAGLTASRDDAVVRAAVSYDADSTAVIVELSV